MNKIRITRTIGDEWCELQVEIRENEGFKELSICAASGVVVSRAQAKRDALAYWESFFEDSPEERRAMAEREDKTFRTARSAARFVLQCDGEFHGLDVHREENGKVYLTMSCGQIREEIARFFPEAVEFFPWHLNSMHAECEHQEARGETWGKNPDAECPDCGYRLGSAWTRRELPAHVLAWVETLRTATKAA